MTRKRVLIVSLNTIYMLSNGKWSSIKHFIKMETLIVDMLCNQEIKSSMCDFESKKTFCANEQ